MNKIILVMIASLFVGCSAVNDMGNSLFNSDDYELYKVQRNTHESFADWEERTGGAEAYRAEVAKREIERGEEFRRQRALQEEEEMKAFNIERDRVRAKREQEEAERKEYQAELQKQRELEAKERQHKRDNPIYFQETKYGIHRVYIDNTWDGKGNLAYTNKVVPDEMATIDFLAKYDFSQYNIHNISVQGKVTRFNAGRDRVIITELGNGQSRIEHFEDGYWGTEKTEQAEKYFKSGKLINGSVG